MHFDLKSISKDAIPKALEKVERYRLLNEPGLAESICMDILAIQPDHQQALVSLLLARTDQFGRGVSVESAQQVLPRIENEYARSYYAGLIWERVGHARIRQGSSGGSASAYHALREAMAHYERAIDFASPGNDDAILRWNTCARVIMQNPDVRPLPDEDAAQAWLHDEAGSRIADA